MVNESDHYSQLEGTETAADASLFYIIPFGDPLYPSDFHMAHWGTRGRQYATHVDDLYRTYNVRGPPLPQYVSIDTDRLGINKGSLSLKTSIEIKEARFSLHSRVQPSFFWKMHTFTPANLSIWLDKKQFYIKCSYHPIFKVDYYLAVKRAKDNQYKVTTVLSAAGKDPTETGMLFRLHPKVIKDKAKENNLTGIVDTGNEPTLSVTAHNNIDEMPAHTVTEVTTQTETPVLDPIIKEPTHTGTPLPDPLIVKLTQTGTPVPDYIKEPAQMTTQTVAEASTQTETPAPDLMTEEHTPTKTPSPDSIIVESSTERTSPGSTEEPGQTEMSVQPSMCACWPSSISLLTVFIVVVAAVLYIMLMHSTPFFGEYLANHQFHYDPM